jgi:hypothetical protein
MPPAVSIQQGYRIDYEGELEQKAIHVTYWFADVGMVKQKAGNGEVLSLKSFSLGPSK